MLNLDKQELAKVGVQFGNLTRRWNPQMRPYLYNNKSISKIHILDLQKIISSCEKIGKYLETIIKQHGKILFLTTKKQASDIVKEQAIKCGMPYIVNKWKGGFLTNFEIIRLKLKELQALNNFFQRDSFKGLIKKEQVILEKKRDKLQKIYEGVIDLWNLPSALFIIGINKENTAVREAKKLGIPIIGICNTNCDPRLVDYVIPGNDDNAKSIGFFANLVAETILKIKKERFSSNFSEKVNQEDETKINYNNKN